MYPQQLTEKRRLSVLSVLSVLTVATLFSLVGTSADGIPAAKTLS